MNEFEDTWSDTENDLLFSKAKWTNYELIEKIGQGGMGAVYKARQLNPQRLVAIKTIKASSNTRRFEREMQIASQLNHPNIAKIYDAGIQNNQKYLVMEYIPGQPLGEYLKQKSLSLQKKLQILIKVCKVLSYAHDLGIIHRDLKPANIIMNQKNEPVLIDFGIAKYTYNRKFDLTKTGEILGTPNYMAPEQITGKSANINHSSDIYSLGTILYEILCGKRMVLGRTPLEALFEIQHGEFTSPRKINKQIDKSLEFIWQKATAYKQKNRYQKAADLQKDLQKFLSGHKIKAPYHKKILLTLFICTISAVLYFSNSQNTNTIELSKRELALEKKLQTVIYRIKNNIPVEVKQLAKSHFNDRHQVSIAKAFYNEGQYEKALAMASPISKESHYYLEAINYKALINYHNKQYNNAQKQFEFLLKANQSFKYHYYLGCIYFKQNLKQKSLFHLLKAEKTFNDDITLVEYLAKIYHKTGNTKKAIEYLERCIILSPKTTEYLTTLGELEMQQKNYYKAFAHLKKALYSKNFIKALTLIHEIPYREPRLRRWCYQSIMHKCVSEKEGEYPDLFTDKWQEIENRYRQDYISYQEAKKSRGKISFFLRTINSLEVKKTTRDALFSLRHSKDFDKEINRVLTNKKLPQTTIDFFHKVANEVREKKRTEQFKVIYHKLAFMYRNKSWSQQNLKSSEFLINALLNEKDPFLKYLIAEGHLQTFSFKPIIKIANDSTQDTVTRIVCCVVLRKNYLAAKIDIFQSLTKIKFTSEENKEFLQTLVAQAMYIPHYIRRIDTFQRPTTLAKRPFPAKEKKLLEHLIAENSFKVSLSAALSFRALISFNRAIPPKFENIILKAMRSSNNTFSNYAHFIFWISNFSVGNDRYFGLFKQALKNPNYRVREIALSQIELFRNRIPDMMPEIENCIKSDSTKLRFRAIFAWTFAQKKKQIIFNDPLYKKMQQQLTPLEHSAIITFVFYKFFFDSGSLKNADNSTITNIFIFIKTLESKLHLLPDKTQCMISYILSLMQIHPSLQQLQKTDDLLLAYFLYQLHQQIDLGDKKSYISFVNPKGPLEKRDLAKSFLSHKNEKVRMYATSSYIAFSSEKERKRLFDKALNSKDTYFKKGVALGYYFAMQNSWIADKKAQSISFTDLFSNKSVDLVLVEKFERLGHFIRQISVKSPQRLKQYRNWITKALELAPEESELIYLHSLLFPQKSTEQIKKAITFNKKHYANNFKHVYLLRFFEILAKQNKISTSPKYIDIPPSLLINFANIYKKSNMYDKVLNLHEKYFLAKTKQHSPFIGALGIHSEMVHCHIKNNSADTAKFLLQYLYELHRRDKIFNEDVSKKVFLDRLKKKNSKIKISW